MELRNIFQKLFYCCFFVLSFTACNNTRYLADNEQLLVKNKIKLNDKKQKVKSALLNNELNALLRYQPNTKFLGIYRLKLWTYNRNKIREEKRKAQQKKIKPKKDKVLEAPVLFNAEAHEGEKTKLAEYLLGKGFFYSKVESETKSKHKKLTVQYNISLGNVFTINKYDIDISDEYIQKLVKDDKPLIIAGTTFDINVLQAERIRVAELLKNSGYYNFSKEYITFDIDSSNGEAFGLDLSLKIDNQSEFASKRYKINKVWIYPNYAPNDTSSLDTIRIKKGYYIIASELKYKPSVILDDILIDSAQWYSRNKHNQTIKRLNDLDVFRFVEIEYVLNEADTTGTTFDCKIYLTPHKINEIAFDLELANSSFSNIFGGSIKSTYTRKNMFKQADLFIFNIKSGFETQFTSGSPFINAVNLSSQVDFTFPKFLVPFKLNRLSQSFNPTSNLSLSYSFLRRVGFYTINSTNLSFGYDWKESSKKRHILNPISVNLVKLSKATTAFLSILNNSSILRRSFSDQIIFGSNYTFIYNDQKSDPLKNYIVSRTTIDVAGNLLRGVNRLASKGEDKTVNYKIFDISFSQYLRLVSDLRYYAIFNRNTQIVSRLSFGLGVPYGNSTVLPYIKQFFAGGPSSIRAWRVRTLGPGSFDGSTTTSRFIDQTADLNLEGNIEYRFKIFKVMKGAIFLDAGNIWLIHDDTTRPGAVFDKKTFLSEIAIAGGLGLRFDFGFFILRLDVATPLRDPALPVNERWRFKAIDITKSRWKKENLIFNLAIGYPF